MMAVFHWLRAATYVAFGIVAMTIQPTLRQSIPVLFVLSILACVESAGAMATAQGAKVAAQEEENEG